MELGARLRPLWRRMTSRNVRSRLTLVYGLLFVASGAVMLVIIGLLWGQSTSNTRYVAFNRVSGTIAQIAISARRISGGAPGATQFVAASPVLNPNKLPITPEGLRRVTAQLHAVASAQQNSDLHNLLLYSGIALGIMAIIAMVAAWLVAGRVLRPLRTITTKAQAISASNLHERLALDGPNDELRNLGDTFDDLLERLDHAFAAQRLFVANASHELRTPLATMRASLDVALAKPDPIPEQTKMLAARLQNELDHIDLMLDSFLALARAQRGVVGEEEVVELNVLISDALLRYATSIDERSLSVEYEPGSEAHVVGNTTLLARMIENVLDNAVRHNDENGWIAISSDVDDSVARVIVENGGEILDEEAVKVLLQPFRRRGAERTGSENGFGLGLSIVAAIAEVHGGGVAIHARKTGGIRVIIELPVDVSQTAAVFA